MEDKDKSLPEGASPVIVAPIMSDICPRGDMYLICGSTYQDGMITKIHVSSAVLNLSSKVFQAMLSPKFKEGTDLLAANSAFPLEIELPDDDPKAMVAICDIVHLRNASFAATDALHSDWVLRIAIGADKYDFTSALKLVSEMWLNNNRIAGSITLRSPSHSCLNMLTASFLFRNAKAFTRFGRSYLLTTRLDVSERPGNQQYDPINKVMKAMEQEKRKHQQTLKDFVELEIEKHVLLRKAPGKPLCAPTCNYAGEFTLTLMDNLMTHALFPTSRIQMAHALFPPSHIQQPLPLGHILDTIARIKAQNPPNSAKVCNTKICPLANSLCSNFGSPPSIKTFQEISNKIRSENKGPCLDCFLVDGKVDLATCKHA